MGGNSDANGKQQPWEGGSSPHDRPTTAQMVCYRKEISRRIQRDPLAHRFFLELVGKYRFDADEIIGGLLDSVFHKSVGRRERLQASPVLPDSVREHLKEPSPGEWKENNPTPDLSIPVKARTLADAIERAEINTPEFGLDQLERCKVSTESERAEVIQDLNKLPATLRVYADYFEKSRGWWRIIGRIELDARSDFQRAARDLLQEQIRTRTGHYSDERYYRLLNIALSVLGRPEVDRNALTMRRKRRDSRRPFHKNR